MVSKLYELPPVAGRRRLVGFSKLDLISSRLGSDEEIPGRHSEGTYAGIYDVLVYVRNTLYT